MDTIFNSENGMKKVILIANGDKPSKKVFSFFQKLGYDKIISADGGADNARKIGIKPDYIIGDLDSVSSDTLKFFEGKSQIIQYKRQNDTDVEKAIKFAVKRGTKQIVLFSGTGNRIDHSFSNLGFVYKYFPKVDISLIHGNSILKCFTGNVEMSVTREEIISIYGIDRKTKITSKGLKYKLTDAALPFGVRDSTSNSALSTKVELKITGGKIFVVRDIKLIMKHDHIF